MSRRGRKAALPDGPHHRPAVLEPATLVVHHRDRQGATATFDFAELPVAAVMQRSLAALFAARCAPGGGWDSFQTSRGNWYSLRAFSKFLAGEQRPPDDVPDLTPAHWNAWRLSRPASVTGYRTYREVASLLRGDPRLNATTREAMAKRMRRVKTQENAYTPEEFDEVRRTARKVFRTALLRIRENTRMLIEWREGRLPPGSPEWVTGEALDTLARTGNVPLQENFPSGHSRWRPVTRVARVLGGEGAEHTWTRLYLGRGEACALAVLLVTEYGVNATTVCEMPAPRATPDSEANGTLVYRIELEKRRRGGSLHHETRNLADFGAASPGRLITEALEATAHARAFTAAAGASRDRLIVWHEHAGQHRPLGDLDGSKIGPFTLGLSTHNVSQWATRQGLPGSVMRRSRKTVNVIHRRGPAQNSQDTHDSVYVLPDPQAHQAAIPVIAAGAEAAVESARRTVFRAELVDAPRPGDEETATAGCRDYTSSPFTPGGTNCRASFLLCTACPNARVAPAHHPRLAHLHAALENLRGVLDTEVWTADWSEAHARLEDLRHRLGPAVWDAALAAATDTDREMIDQLLNGTFDL
ncbi:hypothetical protein ABZ723_04295 [Streptomyces sp. NPDC006700]|uniref:hypothetical protein n=1 Tax=Streptomyces sp. NPDC006700 TaxID=3154479 RepID=UPI0033D3ED0E